MNPTDFGLTLEQDFHLQQIRQDVVRAPKEKLQEFIIELVRQGMIKDNLYKHLMFSDMPRTQHENKA